MPFSVLDSVSSDVDHPVFTAEFSVPFIRTFIVSFVNVLFAKYLSDILTVIDAVFATAFTELLIFCTYGSTTSTSFSEPVPPGIVIPEVIVFAKFVFPVVSSTLPAGTTTVTTPL